MVKVLRYGLAVLVTVGLSEVAPGFVNGLLLLVIVGVILGNFSKFTWFADFISKIGGE